MSWICAEQYKEDNDPMTTSHTRPTRRRELPLQTGSTSEGFIFIATKGLSLYGQLVASKQSPRIAYCAMVEPWRQTRYVEGQALLITGHS